MMEIDDDSGTGWPWSINTREVSPHVDTVLIPGKDRFVVNLQGTANDRLSKKIARCWIDFYYRNVYRCKMNPIEGLPKWDMPEKCAVDGCEFQGYYLQDATGGFHSNLVGAHVVRADAAEYFIAPFCPRHNGQISTNSKLSLEEKVMDSIVVDSLGRVLFRLREGTVLVEIER